MSALDPDRLVFIDEAGITTKMTRSHARALAGERAFGSAPCAWKRVTVLGALGVEGVIAAMTIAAGTTTLVFLAYLRDCLLPALKERKPKAILIMDNLSAHKGDEIHRAIEEAGFTARFLPRYSPDFSPIEPCWSKMKTMLRDKEARSVEALDQEMPGVLDAITPGDAQAWFDHCGYVTPN
jgi:transposase